MKEKIFVDTDIVLDLLAKREPHYIYSAELFSLADQQEISAYVSSLTFANLFYIIRKYTSRKESIKTLSKLKILVNILPVGERIISLALASDFEDFEDAIQYYAAVENNLEIILTRNIKDYKKAEITVITAEEYLKYRKSRAGL